MQEAKLFLKKFRCGSFWWLSAWQLLLFFCTFSIHVRHLIILVYTWWGLHWIWCGRLLTVPPPPVFVVGRFDGTVHRRMNLHFDFGSGRHFGGKVLPTVHRRWRWRCQRRCRALAARTRRTAAAVTVARRRLDYHFWLDDDLVRTGSR